MKYPPPPAPSGVTPLDQAIPGQDVTVIGEFKDGGDLGVEMKSCDF